MLYSRTLLFIHSLYNSLHLLIPTSPSIRPPNPSPWQPQVSSLCLWVCFCFVDRLIWDIPDFECVLDQKWFRCRTHKRSGTCKYFNKSSYGFAETARYLWNKRSLLQDDGPLYPCASRKGLLSCTGPCNTPVLSITETNGHGCHSVQDLRAINEVLLPCFSGCLHF